MPQTFPTVMKPFKTPKNLKKQSRSKKINKYKNYVLSIADHFIQRLFPLLRKQLTNFTNIEFNLKRFLFGWQRNIELRFEAHPRGRVRPQPARLVQVHDAKHAHEVARAPRHVAVLHHHVGRRTSKAVHKSNCRDACTTAQPWPPHHRREAGSMVWQWGSLTARFGQHGFVVAEKWGGAPNSLVVLRTGRRGTSASSWRWT